MINCCYVSYPSFEKKYQFLHKAVPSTSYLKMLLQFWRQKARDINPLALLHFSSTMSWLRKRAPKRPSFTGASLSYSITERKDREYSCSRCGRGFHSTLSLTNHRRAGCTAEPNSNINTVEYTQGEAKRAAQPGGVNSIHNNASVRQAYNDQLRDRPSLGATAARMAHEAAALEERSDDDPIDFMMPSIDDAFFEYQSSFDPMAAASAAEGRDDEPTLPPNYVNKMRRYEEMKNKLPDDLECPKRYHFSNKVGCSALAYAELLKICNKHNAPKKMYDDIATWAQAWSDKDPQVFKVKTRHQKWNRRKILRYLKEIFDVKDMEPNNHTVKLHDGRVVTVPVIDFAAAMRSILDDEEVMKHVMSGLDDTWRPIVSEEEHENDDNVVIDDKVAGHLYRQGIKLHCPDNVDKHLVRPFPVIVHIDKSHSDLFGNLAVAPVQVMPAMIDVDGQQSTAAWRQVATIPNLSAGKGKDGRKSKDSLEKLKDYHKVMSAALSSFVECYENGGFMWEDKQGNKILLKPYIHMFVGDIAGVNEMVGHYNTSKAKCVVKDCKCDHEELVQFPPKCQQVSWADLQSCNSVEEIFEMYQKRGLVSEADMARARTDADFAQSISKHSIDNAFDKLPLADPYQGIIGMTPQEMLHVMGCGMFKYLILGVKDVIGENNTNSKVKGQINDIFPDMKMYLNRNAERDVCRMSNRNGFFNVTSLTNDEVRGNFLGLVALMHTSYGESLLRPLFEEAGKDYKQVLETCCLVLAWERFHMDPQKRRDLVSAEEVTWDLQKRIMRDIPREPREKTEKRAGSNGWQIAKFHCISFFSRMCLKFGPGKCSDSGANENNHKKFVKGNAKLTQRISSKFASQLISNDYDRVVIDTVYAHIKRHCSQDHDGSASDVVTCNARQYYGDSDEEVEEENNAIYDEEVEEDNNDNGVTNHPSQINEGVISLSGKYTLDMSIDSRGKTTVTHAWKSPHRQMLAVAPSPFVSKHISDMTLKYRTELGLSTSTKIKCECYMNGVVKDFRYRASPYWKGSEWYDFASIQFPSTMESIVGEKSIGGDTCICRIMAFVKFSSPGVLTYRFIEMEGRDPADIENVIDETVYVVIQCQTQYYSHSRHQSQFIRKFKMEGANNMHMLPASCLRMGLIVFPDIIDERTASTTNYLVMLPRHKMGVYFIYHMTKFEEENGEEEPMRKKQKKSKKEKEEAKMYGDNW